MTSSSSSSPSSSRSSSPEPRVYTLEQEKLDLIIEVLKQAKVSENIINQLTAESLDIEGIIKILEETIGTLDKDIAIVAKLVDFAGKAREFQHGMNQDGGTGGAGAGPSMPSSSKP